MKINLRLIIEAIQYMIISINVIDNILFLLLQPLTMAKVKISKR